LRQLNGRPQWAQSFCGSSAFLRMRGMAGSVQPLARRCNLPVMLGG
jgi:hypothetical protein